MRAICAREARRVLGASADAEEAAQEAVIRAWRNRDQLADDARVAGWIRQIARREALRVRDRRTRQPEPIATVEDSGATDDAIEELAGRLDLDSALRGFSSLDRTLIVLRYLHDLTQPQIAAAVGMPEGTVKIRLHRARARLRQSLGVTQPPVSEERA